MRSNWSLDADTQPMAAPSARVLRAGYFYVVWHWRRMHSASKALRALRSCGGWQSHRA